MKLTLDRERLVMEIEARCRNPFTVGPLLVACARVQAGRLTGRELDEATRDFGRLLARHVVAALESSRAVDAAEGDVDDEVTTAVIRIPREIREAALGVADTVVLEAGRGTKA